MPRPVVFIGSSTEAQGVAEAVRRFLEGSAEVNVWSSAFNPGEWTLQVILDHAQRSDFGIFVMTPDDQGVIRKKAKLTVRDNVLFEVGIFMGALGPKRTFLLWPSKKADQLRLPTDLLGLTTLSYEFGKGLKEPEWDKRLGESEVARIRRVIQDSGPAVRSTYNEIAALTQRLDEKEKSFTDGTSASFKDIIAPVAARRKRPWFRGTPVEMLLEGISEGYKDRIVDEVFWWLIVYGVITFNNIEIWSSGGDWHWADSMEYAVFTDRGVVLLNQFRSGHRR